MKRLSLAVILVLVMMLVFGALGCTNTVYVTPTPTSAPALPTTASPTPTPTPTPTPSGACSNKNTITPEVTLGEMRLHTPDTSGWYGAQPSFDDPDFEGYISVELIPNDKTIPNQRYSVCLCYKGQIIDDWAYPYWDTKALTPGFFGVDYIGNTQIWYFHLSKQHELYTIYFDQFNKPVSQRHFDIQDYVHVTVTK